MPAMQPYSRTAKDSSGVGRRDSNRRTGMPLPAMTQAASRAKSSELLRQSKQTATPRCGGLGPLLQDDLGEGLGGVADDVDVHPVQPHPHGAPQAGGAEGQLVEKAGLDLLVVALDGLQLRLLRGGEGRAVQPLLISITIGHIVGPPINKIRWDMLLWTLYHRQA